MPLPKESYYTFADLLTWEDDKRYELIDGVPYLMSPAPSKSHQLISMELSRQLSTYLLNKKCTVLAAPFDVRLFEREGDRPEDVMTVVQPDIVVICDPDKLDERGCKGAPDLVIEILSPSNQGHDRVTKLNLYERARVQEYWIVDPLYKSVQIFILEGDRYRATSYGSPGDKLKINVLEDCYIDLSLVFPE